jgi:DNA helicase-2/ATP-dependent DNA helicase PcrA
VLDAGIEAETLNESQRRALETLDEPVLLLAGPGSGKTQVLTLRATRLIEESPDQHFRVLGLTFTNKAAAEMRARVGERLGSQASRTLLTTFHSFAATVLRQHGSHVGVRPDFAILAQEADRSAVLRDVIARLAEAGSALERDEVRLLPLIDNLLAKLVLPQDVRRHIRDPALGDALVQLYGGYRDQLLSSNQLDFATLLCLAHELFTERPAVARQLRAIYPHVLVDEFQDTNLAQFELLQAFLGGDGRGLFVVADDDQMIFQWNGASPERLSALRATYAMLVIQLPTNYRCPPSVVHLANLLIAHNHRNGDDRLPLVAGVANEVEDSVIVKRFATLDQELEYLAGELSATPRGQRGQHVVLARTRRLLEAAHDRLMARGIEAVMATRKTDFETAPLRWLVAMLRLGVGRADPQALRVACRAFFELEGIEVRPEDVVASSAARGGDLLRSFFAEALARDELEPDTRDHLARSQDLLAERGDHRHFVDSSFEWFETATRRSGVVNGDRSSDDYELESAIWNEIRTTITARFGSDVTLSAFLHELDLAPKAPPVPPGAVRCFTIHNAKGMEFGHVHLIGLVEDQLPSFQAIKKGPDSREMQEERRNCFVAITRARERLTLSYAREYFGWGKVPSRFLREMGFEPD